MKHLLVVLGLAAVPHAAFAAQGPLTDAPVPDAAPSMPSRSGPSPVPEQIATSPGTSLAGPANATPFSAAPPGLLPNNGQGTSTHDPVGPGQARQSLPQCHAVTEPALFACGTASGEG